MHGADKSPGMKTFRDIVELSTLSEEDAVLQLGPEGGLWFKAEGPAEGNGGTVAPGDPSCHWRRQCDPGRLDARWFGVRADGITDDGAALQAAIDALPADGGTVLLPSGRMRITAPLQIQRSFVNLEGTNCGLLSKQFEPAAVIGRGSMLLLDGCDGVIIQPEPSTPEEKSSRLGGITFRDLGFAGNGRQAGQRGVVVNTGEERGWGSTDGLMMERVYCIDLEWSVVLHDCDMTVLTGCWFSECGNGIHLERCVYNCITNCCLADNDGIGIRIVRGHGHELTGNVFVRNPLCLTLTATREIRVVGGTFEAEAEEENSCLIHCRDSEHIQITGALLKVMGAGTMTAPVRFAGEPPLCTGCAFGGNQQQQILPMSGS